MVPLASLACTSSNKVFLQKQKSCKILLQYLSKVNCKKSAGMSNAFFVNLGIPILFESHHKRQINESNLHISRTPKKDIVASFVGFFKIALKFTFGKPVLKPSSSLRSFITTHKFQLHSAWKGSEISLSPLLLLYPLGKGYQKANFRKPRFEFQAKLLLQKYIFR